MRKFLVFSLIACFLAMPLSFAYFNPDSEEYEIVFEGATADDYETTLAVTDPTADRTITLPNNSGTLNISATGYEDTIVMEGATANDFETTFAITDPTADRTITFTDATGTVSLIESAETLSGVKTFSADPLITGTTPLLTIGDGGDEDAGIQINSDTTDYYIASENSADALVIGTGSAIGTTPALTILGQGVTAESTMAFTGVATFNADPIVAGTTPKLTIGDGGEEDAQLAFDGHSGGTDWHITLDDSADELEIGVGTAPDTTPALTIASATQISSFQQDVNVLGTTPLLTIGDAGDEDAGIQINSDTTDYYIASENSVDALIIGTGAAIGTTPAITVLGQGVTTNGMLTTTGGHTGNVETLTTTEALAAADSGKILVLDHATEFVTTLPAPAAGLNFTIVVGNAPETASFTVVTATSANIIQGCVGTSEDAAGSVACAASSDTITFVDGKAIVGDYVKLASDGTSWFVVGGNCAVQDGITVTQAS